jgi:hypothetical protein
MGASGSSSRRIILEDGTDCGEASAGGEAFAAAIRRMHCLAPDCDDELRRASECANVHGQQSPEFAAAYARLGACQTRRGNQLAAIEARCGPSQDAFKTCLQEHGTTTAAECLPKLHAFLDCAEHAADRPTVT